jgi:hypothetical protein
MFSWIKSLFGFGKVDVEVSQTEVVAEAPVVEPVVEKPAPAKSKPKKEKLPKFDDMTKAQIDEWAAERGIDLDRRKTKKVMIETLKQKLKEK